MEVEVNPTPITHSPPTTGCVEFGGDLVITLDESSRVTDGEKIDLVYYQCHAGKFETIETVNSDPNTCQITTAQPMYPPSLYLLLCLSLTPSVSVSLTLCFTPCISSRSVSHSVSLSLSPSVPSSLPLPRYSDNKLSVVMTVSEDEGCQQKPSMPAGVIAAIVVSTIVLVALLLLGLSWKRGLLQGPETPPTHTLSPHPSL